MSGTSVLCRLLAPVAYKVMGIDIFARKKWLETAALWSPEKRKAWRLARLGNLLEHCWINVPFYREYWSSHGVKMRRLESLDELQAYPRVTRELLKENRLQCVATNLSQIPHKTDSTGGTTGSPLKYYHDLELHALRYGYQLMGWGLAGYRFGDEVFVAAGGSLVSGQQTLRNSCRDWLERKKGLSCLQMDRKLALDCYAAMIAQRTKFIHGYPSTITLLAEHLAENGLKVESVQAIITTAEMLLPQYRRTIEKVFRVPVFDHYGCNDGGLLSYECAVHKGYHYNDFESVLEVLDPDISGVGRLAITNLWNRSMPFVRYENGDMLMLAGGKCTCGFPFPVIQEVSGRTADVLRFANGKSLTGPGVTLIFKEMDLQGWQVVQTGPGSLEVRLLATHSLAEAREQYIQDVLRLHLSDGVRVNLRYVDQLTVTSRGKLKPVFVEGT